MCANDCNQLLERFSLGQKILLRFLLGTFIAVGAYAIFLHSFWWGWIYLGVAILGQAFFVLPSLCGHCPYPNQYRDCLFLPAGIMRRLVGYRGPKVTASETALIGITLLLVVGIPQVWLIKHTGLLILFWAVLLPFLAYFPFSLCKRCRHTGCPSNRVRQNIGPAPIQRQR
jgi:hypothetical protein